jgi:hypothetical protein
MKMHFRRAFTFARQGGSASCAESAQPAGGRIELRYLPFGYGISVAPECHEHGDGRATVLSTALAVAPRYAYRFTGGDKSHRAAQASALNFGAHLAIPPLRPQAVVSIGRPGFSRDDIKVNPRRLHLVLGRPLYQEAERKQARKQASL